MNICPECKAKVDIYVAGFCLSCAGKYITKQAKQLEQLKGFVKMALDELGIPTKDYPAPVSNAVNILQQTLKCETVEIVS